MVTFRNEQDGAPQNGTAKELLVVVELVLIAVLISRVFVLNTSLVRA